MILKYNRWKTLNEEKARTSQTYLTFNFGKGKSERILPGNAADATLVAIPFFKRVYPGAKIITQGFSGISFSNTRYENIDGEKEDLILNFNDLFTPGYQDKAYTQAYQELVFPDFIKIDILKLLTNQIINRSNEDYEIIVNEKFANLEEPQIREMMIALAKEYIEKKLDVNLSGTNLADSIEALIVQNSLGDMFKDKSEELKLIRTPLAQYTLNKITEIINNLQFKREVVNLDELAEQIAKRSSKFLIDYSTLTKAEIQAIIPALQEYLYYLNKTLRKRSIASQEIGVANIKTILRHISQYPDAAELIYTS